MTFAPHAVFCEDCHRLTPADDVERRPHETVLIAECRCGHVVSRVFPTLLSRASSRPPVRDGASRANRPSRLRRSRRRTRSQSTTASSKRLPLMAGGLPFGGQAFPRPSLSLPPYSSTAFDAATAPTTPGSPPAGASRRGCSVSVTTAQGLTSRPGSPSVM